MGEKKERMTSTSVYLPGIFLDRITILKDKPSRYIREAVREKLERDEGFISAIERAKIKRVALKKELQELDHIIVELEKKHEVWKKKQERSRIYDAIVNEVLIRSYATEEDLFIAVGNQFTDLVELEEIVHEVWLKFKGET